MKSFATPFWACLLLVAITSNFVYADECVCMNGGTCTVVNATAGTTHCDCNAGYMGTQCEVSICTTLAPCMNGASCVVATTIDIGYVCQCNGFFGGVNCTDAWSPNDLPLVKYLQDKVNNLELFGFRIGYPVAAFILLALAIAAVIFYRRWKNASQTTSVSDAIVQSIATAEGSGQSQLSMNDLVQMSAASPTAATAGDVESGIVSNSAVVAVPATSPVTQVMSVGPVSPPTKGAAARISTKSTRVSRRPGGK